jgi:hypothetical protein
MGLTLGHPAGDADVVPPQGKTLKVGGGCGTDLEHVSSGGRIIGSWLGGDVRSFLHLMSHFPARNVKKIYTASALF